MFLFVLLGRFARRGGMCVLGFLFLLSSLSLLPMLLFELGQLLLLLLLDLFLPLFVGILLLQLLLLLILLPLELLSFLILLLLKLFVLLLVLLFQLRVCNRRGPGVRRSIHRRLGARSFVGGGARILWRPARDHRPVRIRRL